MEEIIRSQIGTIASTGLVGAFLILSVYVNYLQAKENRRIQKERMDDYKDLRQDLNNSSLVISKWTDSSEARNRAMEALEKSQGLAGQAQITLAATLANVCSKLETLSDDQQRTRDALLKKGVDL